MTASVKREELHAFSDGAALLGVAVFAVIGFAWAAAGRDPGIVLAGSILMIASAMSGVYLLDRFRGKAPPVDETGYADGVIRAGVIATVFWGIAGFLVGDLIAWQLAYPILNLDLEWTSFGRLRPLHTSAVIFAFGGNALIASSFYVVSARAARGLPGAGWRLWLHQFRREPNAVREWADAMVAVATEQGLAQSLLFATLSRGWALSMGEHIEEGIASLRAGMEKYQSMGAAMMVGYFKALLAEAYSRAGLAAQGLSELDGALECAKRTGERFWEAEIHRLRGELLLQSRTQSSESEVQEEAAACFHKAINVARRQSAKSLELRAVMSLARLWHRQGKRTAARQMLAEIYGWFTEGFETKDLQDATALLKELESQEGERQRGNRGSRHRTTVQTVRKRTRDKRLAR